MYVSTVYPVTMRRLLFLGEVATERGRGEMLSRRETELGHQVSTNAGQSPRTETHTLNVMSSPTEELASFRAVYRSERDQLYGVVTMLVPDECTS